MKMENKSYYEDKIRAFDAKIEAQKIAFSPMTFQAIRALIELGLLQKISDSGDDGITIKELSADSGISEYGVGVLAEMALGMGVLKINPEATDDESASGLGKLVLGKVGWFLLEDDCTRVNFNFTNDICYKGAFNLIDSIKNGKPEGLRVFGDKWTTVYEALSTLPEREKKSWFEFDHFYSDVAFPEALPIVYAKKPKHLFDIGGNTGKWAIASCKYDKDVHVSIVDLPGQTAVAEKNARDAGFADRISFVSGNVLDSETKLPAGADAVWMSQFLDCFSLHQITKILTKIYNSVDENCDVFVMEPLWDMQKFEGESYALQATSLYFTCIANGNSKMYRYGELVEAIEKAGFKLVTAHHNLGSNFYSILNFRKLKVES
ncbi:MAG: class I SAM-dependent methyltransferase [Treponema sp.]|uniref:methyltransferase n=1 Tax=Treponema sp. TaxID=166 RepID=UPI0025DD83DB|nr:class I SAM-dependent methyltransferase [Treponema sp.]MBQ8679437.1 class I SAM-dependent methyltransferase [Treponema sp.]